MRYGICKRTARPEASISGNSMQPTEGQMLIGGTLASRDMPDHTVEDAPPPRGAVVVPKPSLCIVNYNGARFLAATIEAALAEAGSVSELLVIDNGSLDESLAVAARFPEVRTIALGDNRGASAVRNAALRAATSDLVLLVDSDVRLVPGCAATLTEALVQRPGAAVAMPRVLYEADPALVQYDGADAHFSGLQALRHRDRPVAGLGDAVREIGSVITACVLVDRRAAGPDPFDEDFFIYLEDHDFAVRLRSRGHSILSVPAARCRHAEGTPGLSIRAEGRYTSLRVFCLIRNRWQFIAKNYEGRTLAMLAPILALYEVTQLVAVAKKGWLREWVRAAWWMVRRSPELIARRREIQDRRRLPDRELLVGGAMPFRDELASTPLESRGRQLLDDLASAYWRLVGSSL